MARIPFIEQQVSAGGVPDLATARPTQAFARLGQEAGQAENLLTQIAERDAALDGAAAFADFRTARAKRQTELRTATKTPETFTDEALQDFDKSAEELVSAHENPRVQQYLDQRLVAAREQEAIESDQWSAGVMMQRSETKALEAVNKFANVVNSQPGKFQDALGDVAAMIEAAGLPLPNADKLRSAAKSALSRSAVYGQIETDPAGVLKQLNDGKWDSYLDNDTKISAVNAAQGELKRREAEARANAAQARAEASADAAELVQSDIIGRTTLGKGVALEDQQKIKAGLTDKQWEKYQSAVQRADAVYALAGDLRTKSNLEIQNTIMAAKPKLNADGTAPADLADQQAAYAAAQSIATNELTKRKTDPASAVRDAFPRVADAWASVAQNNNDPGWVRVAIKRTMAAQDAIGVPADQRKPLPAQFALSVAGDIRGAPADQAAKKLSDYARMFGENWKTVYAQIAPHLDSSAAVAATLSPNMAAVLLETSRTTGTPGKPGSGVDALRKSLGVASSGDKSITGIIAADPDFAEFRRAMVSRANGGNIGVTWADGTEKLALGLMAREGIGFQEAAQRAMKETVGDKYNFGRVNGVPFVTPKRVDADTAERGARTILSNLKGDGLDLPGADPGAITADTRNQYLGAVQRNGYWVTMPGNIGLELWAGGVPVTRYGQKIRSTWDVLSGAAPGISAEDRTKANQDRYKKIFKKVGE